MSVQDGVWVVIIVVASIDLQQRLIWESDRPWAMVVQYRAIQVGEWIITRARRGR